MSSLVNRILETAKHAVLLTAVAFVTASAYSADIGYVDGDGVIHKPFDLFWVDRLQSQGHTVTQLPVDYDPAGPEASNVDFFIVSADIGSGDFVSGIGPEIEFTNFEGSFYFGGANMDEDFAGGPPRMINFNPVDLSGQTDVELTIAFAARTTGWDSDIDFMNLRLDADGDSDFETELADFQPINGDLEDTIGGAILNTTFQDLTIPIDSNINTLRLQIDAFSTAAGEQLGFDNIRVTGSGGVVIATENFEGDADQLGYTTVGEGGAGDTFFGVVAGGVSGISPRVTDPRPIITTEPALQDDFQMTDVAGAVLPSASFIIIEDAGHPLAAGLSGSDVEVYVTDQGLTHLLDDAGAGDIAPGVDVVATEQGLPVIAVLEAGAEGMDGNPSPGQRIAFFPDDDGDGDLYTEDGLKLLDAAIAHALANVPAGDANDCSGDGVVDINDTNCATTETLADILAAANLIHGDADGDGQVQFSDLTILANNFGQPGQYTDGDFDLDGTVQFGDLTVLANNFGLSAGAIAVVPEPTSTFAFLVSMLGTLTLSRRRRGRKHLCRS